ncbi:oligosaccharide flippase family protein [Sinobaca sp. H24]|uniref:oligosaccharide flippase family protein n=1 Tax=Sinobaca sp. H24 TaxID=2923376 RepID=UPI002079C7D4|nr:oligosaccharide flippase family protein [Sinobaca sp. H24]
MKIWVISTLISLVIATIYYSTGSDDMYGWNLLLIPLVTIPFMLMNKYTEGMLLGLQDILTINFKQIIGFIANLLFLIIFVIILDWGIFGAAIITLLSAVVVLIYSFIILNKSVKITKEKQHNVTSSLIKKGFIYAVALFILSLNYKIDILFLERLSDSVEVGIYSVGVNLTELIWQVPAAMDGFIF